MPKKSAPSAGPRPIRVSDGAYREAKRLLEIASLRGWSALGIERTDPPSMMAIMEEALLFLAKRAAKG